MDGFSLDDLEPYDVRHLQDEYHSFSPRDTYVLLCHKVGVKPVPTVAKFFPAEPGNWDNVVRLDLSLSYVGHKGFLVMLQMCMRLPKLTYFSAADNHLTNDSIYALARMALFHPGLCEIDVSSNPFVSWSAAMWLLELVQRNQQITCLLTTGTSIEEDWQELLFEQTRHNAAAMFVAKGGASKPTHHPNATFLRAIKRYFQDIQDENGTVPVASIIDGFNELQRIKGKKVERQTHSESFFQAMVARAPSVERLDWQAFAVILFCSGISYNPRLSHEIRRVFDAFNVAPPKHEPQVEVKDFPLIYERLFHRKMLPTDAAQYTARMGLELGMTALWDEFLITFYPHGPEEGERPVGILNTPMGTLDSLAHY